MRFLLLILMIALLPLRSWALVAEPSSAHLATFNAIKKEAAKAQPELPEATIGSIKSPEHHCHPVAQSTSEGVDQASQAMPPTPQAPCSSCADCALCHTLATTSTPLLPSPPLLSHWLRPNGGDRFDSALAALSLKPPIA